MAGKRRAGAGDVVGCGGQGPQAGEGFGYYSQCDGQQGSVG